MLFQRLVLHPCSKIKMLTTFNGCVAATIVDFERLIGGEYPTLCLFSIQKITLHDLFWDERAALLLLHVRPTTVAQ